MKKVRNLNHFKKLIKAGNRYFIITLNGGVGSWKEISLTKTGKFRILNRIDDSRQVLSDKELFDEGITNIGKAIKVGGFYCKEGK